MNDLGKSIDNMVKETNPTGQIAKKPTDYKGVQTTPYGHVFNFNGGSITDKGAERASMKMPVEKGKNYGFTYTKGGDEVYADTFEEAYKALAYPSPKKNMIHTPESAKARINELQTYMDSLGENDSVDLGFANELDTLKKLQAVSQDKNSAKEAEAYYKQAGDIIGKNAVAGRDLLEGVDKARFEEAKKVLSRNARGLGNIESQYIDLMNKGWKQQDVEAELAKRGFSKDDIENAYSEVRYGERYKDWKGNDNYVDASKYQISKKNPIDVKNANMFKSEEDYKAFIAPMIKDRIAEYKKAGMDNKTMLAELNDEFGYKDLISQALSDFDKANPNYNPYAHELKKATNYDDYEKLVDEYYKNLNDADYRKGLDSNRRKILDQAFGDMDFKENKEGQTIGEFISANDLVNKYPKDEDYIKAVEPFLKEVGDAYHALNPKQRWTPRDELTELAHYYRRHPKPVLEKVPELTREEKIANLKERFKNDPEKLRLIDDLLPMMEELFK